MLQIHCKYLFNKLNRIIIAVVLFLVLIAFILAINLRISFNQRWLNRIDNFNSFYQVIIFIGKFIGVLLSSYLLGSAFSNGADGYCVLFIRNGRDKVFHCFTKIIVIEVIVLLIMFLFGIFSSFVICLFSTWFNNIWLLIESFLTLGLLGLIYGNLSLIFVLLFKTHFSLIISFVLFLMVEVISETPDNSLVTFITIVLPTFQVLLRDDSSYYLEGYQILHFIILIAFYNLLAITFYYSKDVSF